MDQPRDTETIDDLSALAWVQDELRRSLEAAHKSLRRYLKESEAQAGSDLDAVDPNVLRHARSQIHQGVGALELVGLSAAATLLRSSEAAVQRLAAQPRRLDAHAVEAVERGSFALLDYLARMLAGKPVSPVALFPQYRALQALAGAQRVHPADLWPVDWHWRDLPTDGRATARLADAAARSAVEEQLLALMRAPQGPAAARMSDLFANLGAGAPDKRLKTLWSLAAAFFEGQAHGLVVSDVYSKRVASRLLAQLRVGERGETEVSDRLAQDMLFFCAQASIPAGVDAPRLSAVRKAFGLSGAVPVDYESSGLGRFDPSVVVQARKRVSGARDAWSAVAGGEMHRLPGLVEQFALVGDSLRRLYSHGEQLADALHDAVAGTVEKGESPEPALAMEVATSVLFLEASLEDADFDDPGHGVRIERLAQRISRVRHGGSAEPLESWMEDLYRRVSDRQTMGSVVQELRSALSEAEKLIDQFFRQPSERSVLIPVPSQLQAMRGVLSVLGLDHASHAVLRMREDVDTLIQTDAAPGQATGDGPVDRLAANLGALGFLVDMLGVQPQMAKSLFVFDAASGYLRSVVGGGTARVSGFGGLEAHAELAEQAQSLAATASQPDVPLEVVTRDLERLSQEALIADQPSLADAVHTAQAALARAGADPAQGHAALQELAQAMTDFAATASGAPALAPEPVSQPMQLAPMTLAPAPTPAGATGLEDDTEMRDIFLEEAREVMDNAQAALAALADAPDDVGELTTVRRAFHTLKGSSRMVGLRDFGEAAWSCEQLYNARLADRPRADDELRGFTLDVLAYLGDWIECIAAGRTGGHDPRIVAQAADAMRHDGARRPLPLPLAAVQAFTAPAVPEATPAVEHLAPASEPVLEPVRQPDAAALPQPGFAPLDATPVPDADAPPLELPSQFGVGLPDASPPAPVRREEVVDVQMDDAPEEDGFTTAVMPLGGAVDEPPPVPEAVELIDLDFLAMAPPPPAPAPDEPKPDEPRPEPKPDEPRQEPKPQMAEAAAPTHATVPMVTPEPVAETPDPAQFKVIGPLSIPIPLFNIYLNEADELSRRLSTELAEWTMELHRPVGDHAIALAHSLAGNSATVGFSDLSHLARSLEHALMRSNALGRGDAEDARLFVQVSEEIRRLLHQFAAGFLPEVPTLLWQRLAEHERHAGEKLEAQSVRGELPAEPAEEPPSLRAPSRPAPLPANSGFAPLAPHSGFGPLAPLSGFGELGQPEVRTVGQLPEVRSTPAARDALEDEDDLDAIDQVDAELFPIFEEEGQELLPQLSQRMRDWARRPSDAAGGSACMRTLHTFKGGARLAGAMRLGEMAHRLETAIEHVVAQGHPVPADIERLQVRADALASAFEALRSRDAEAYAAASGAVEHALPTVTVVDSEPMPLVELPEFHADPSTPPQVPAFELRPEETAPQAHALPPPVVEPAEAAPVAHVAPVAEPAPTASPVAPALPSVARTDSIDWRRFSVGSGTPLPSAERPAVSHAAVRVRAPLLDRLVNHAGEVSIHRSRIESDVTQLKSSLSDLTENLERLRRQLRDIELQAETQIASRMEAAKAASQDFDPLEFDRFTRFQELTRMMAESVNDVATVQRSLQRTLQSAEDELAAQARLTRDMQDDLLRTRMVEFDSMSERLYRVVRQAAKETGKHVRLDIVGGSIEVDRGVLDRMTGAFEHLLRNCVTHGIESPDARTAAGKDPSGQITVSLAHERNEVAVEVRDDGAGLNLGRIRAKGEAMGMIAPGAEATEAELAGLIFTPGFTTADKVTELAGRGIGMDVVRNEVNAMGGRIETATASGQGTSFRLVLPLTTAVTQVVMLRCGATTVAVPSTLVEIVRRAKPGEIDECYATGHYTLGDKSLPFFWLGALLQGSGRSHETGRTLPVVVIRSAQQRIALHVDEVLGNHEVVVKNLGSQLSRLPGLAGMTLLASGAPALIYNPVALATLYGESAWALTREALASAAQPAAAAATVAEAAAAQAPLVLVVDDSLTVRRVTQRLLVREGYRVTLAKDGLEGLEKLAEERPAVLLSDIEMPRMDGFDLVRNLRGDSRLTDLPVIMITSRIAQKHRDYAAELGVNHYLGKPYSEEDLLALVARYATVAVAV
jgi:chemosensory pili system protein ChpA (sensor histidine kinase/response regulator)